MLTRKIAGWKEDEWIHSLLTRPGGQGLRAVWVLKGEKLGANRWLQCWKEVLRVSMQRGGWPMSRPSLDCINLRMRIHWLWMQTSRKWTGEQLIKEYLYYSEFINLNNQMPHRGPTCGGGGRKESGLHTLQCDVVVKCGGFAIIHDGQKQKQFPHIEFIPSYQLLVGGQAPGFWKAHRNNFDCDRCYINK